MIAALSRFVSRAANQSLPFFKVLKNGVEFKWTPECENALSELKQILSEPPILMNLYLAVAEETVSAVLIRETIEGQRPVYFVSKVLQGAESRYQKIEKVALALVVAARRLRPYFVAHQVVVKTDQPIRQVLHRPDLAGRIIKWVVELSEFGIKYEAWSALKAQVLADFVADMTPTPSESVPLQWKLHVDGSSNSKGSGVGLILENSEGLMIEVSLNFTFNTSNNQTGYEAGIARLKLASDFAAKTIELNKDSLRVVSQVKKDFVTNDPIPQRYLARVCELLLQFEHVEQKHVPRAENARADVLAKLASTKPIGNLRSII